MNLNQIENIIWDWNGTLLNDIEMCINCMNQLLEPRNIPKLNIEKYREVFTFPVQDYYKEIGIDFEKDPFDIIGHDFMDLYFEGLKSCNLHSDVVSTLQEFQMAGKKQYILSAMEHDALIQALKDYQISSYLESAFGIDNHLAAGKTDRGIQLFKEFQIEPEKTILIGDTLHDVEVADELEISCVLVSNGHQSQARLKTSGVEVFHNLTELFMALR